MSLDVIGHPPGSSAGIDDSWQAVTRQATTLTHWVVTSRPNAPAP